MEIKVDIIVLFLASVGAAWALMRYFVFAPMKDIAGDVKDMNLTIHKSFANIDKRVTVLETITLQESLKSKERK